MLENVKNLLSDGVTALGGILIVFGLVNLGLTIKDGMQGNYLSSITFFMRKMAENNMQKTGLKNL